MPLEIERKFLVISDGWRAHINRSDKIIQGYLANTQKSSIRIRCTETKADINIKSMTVGISRSEYEYPIPLDEARLILDTLCIKPLIHKTRHMVRDAGLEWEVDCFEGENDGLVVAELELDDSETKFEIPDWLGEEVSNDLKYYNISLVNKPYCQW